MKSFALILLFFLFHAPAASAQIKHIDVDSLVTANLGEFSQQTGNALDLSDSTATVVVFFEELFFDSLKRDSDKDLSDFLYFSRPRASASLFQLIYFDAESHSFQKRTIDTLDVNSGWSACHFTNVVDSVVVLSHGNSTSLVLLMCHPVYPTCNSMTSYFLQSYAFSRISDEFIFTREKLKKSSVYPRGANWKQQAFNTVSW